jgi:predicted transglutaminase-like cysteine proteinase
MYSPRVFVVFCLMAIVGIPTEAWAATRNENHPNSTDSKILEGSPALAPFQHVRFCIRNPSDCSATSSAENPIAITPEAMATLRAVNRTINASIRPIVKIHGTNLAEGWEIAPISGDCNDYAVTKRHVLLEKGLPSSALRLSVTRTSLGQGHLVLVVSTSKGDLVLDNLNPEILPWVSTDYQWLKIQSAVDPRLWYDVADPARMSSLSVETTLRVARR